MNDAEKSLSQLHPARREIVPLILLSVTGLCFGLYLPVLTMKKFVLWTDTFSVISGIVALAKQGYVFLAAFIFLFSVVFPLVKLMTLLLIWFSRMTRQRRRVVLYWLALLGKWSMLDVFVVALTIVLTKAGDLIDARPRPGLYVFGGAVLLSMITTVFFDRLAARTKSE